MVHTSSIALFATAAIFAASPALGVALPRSDLAVGEGSMYSRFFGISQYDGRALSKVQEEKKLINELEQLENGSPKKKNNAKKGPVKHNNKAKHSLLSVHKTTTSSKPARSSSARASATKPSNRAHITGTSKTHTSTKASATGAATKTSSSKASASVTKSSSVTKTTSSSKASGTSTSRASSASSVKPTSTGRAHGHERRPTGNPNFDAQRKKQNLEKHLIDELEHLEGRDDAEYEFSLRDYEDEMMNIALRAYYEDELE